MENRSCYLCCLRNIYWKLDESINALDASGAMQVREILKEQNERGAICIIACHDSEELEYLSDEIIQI